MTYTPRQGQIFDTNHLLLIKNLKEKLLSVKNISSVISIVDIPLVESSTIPLIEMANNVPNILSSEIDIVKAQNEILNSPIYKDLIISSDGKTTAMQINLKKNDDLISLYNQKSELTDKKKYNDASAEELIRLKEITRNYSEIKETHEQGIHDLLNSVRLIQNQFSIEHNVYQQCCQIGHYIIVRLHHC